MFWADEQLQPGDVIVAEDGHPHEVTSDGLLSLLDVATWRLISAGSPTPLHSYLEQRDMSELPVARLI